MCHSQMPKWHGMSIDSFSMLWMRVHIRCMEANTHKYTQAHPTRIPGNAAARTHRQSLARVHAHQHAHETAHISSHLVIDAIASQRGN